MLIFQAGKWHDISLPDYIDPSWDISQRAHAAHMLNLGYKWIRIEEVIYGSRGKSIAAQSTKKKRVV
jgi:hypothetical protein